MRNDSSEKVMRINSLDLARGLAVFFMILVHVLETYGRDDVYDHFVGKAVEFFGSAPAAPVFMFIMGFFLAYPSDKGLKAGVIRGLKIMALGYLLSFMRYNLPEALGITSYPYEFDLFSFIWEIDILPFAGFAMILLALIRRYIPSPKIWIIMAISITAVSPFLWGISSGNAPIDWFLDFLWGTYEEVYFPVFPWLTFPLLGMAFRNYCTIDEGRVVTSGKTTKFVILVLIAGICITLTNVKFHYGDYYRSGPGAMIWMSGFVIVWIFICGKAVQMIPENTLFKLLYFWSKNVTVVYFIQWMIIGWGVAIFPYEKQPLMTTVVLMVLIVPLTHWITRGWLYLVSFKRRKAD